MLVRRSRSRPCNRSSSTSAASTRSAPRHTSASPENVRQGRCGRSGWGITGRPDGARVSVLGRLRKVAIRTRLAIILWIPAARWANAARGGSAKLWISSIDVVGSATLDLQVRQCVFEDGERFGLADADVAVHLGAVALQQAGPDEADDHGEHDDARYDEGQRRELRGAQDLVQVQH